MARFALFPGETRPRAPPAPNWGQISALCSCTTGEWGRDSSLKMNPPNELRVGGEPGLRCRFRVRSDTLISVTLRLSPAPRQ